MAYRHQNALYKALEAKFKSQRQTALSTLDVYFTNPAGIGEHPQIVEEMEKQLKSLSEAEDCLQTLKNNLHEMENL